MVILTILIVLVSRATPQLRSRVFLTLELPRTKAQIFITDIKVNKKR